MDHVCGQCAGEEPPVRRTYHQHLLLRQEGYKFEAPLPKQHEMEWPAFHPAQQPALILVVETQLIALNVGVSPMRGVLSERLIAPLSITNPSSKGRISLQACSRRGIHRGLPVQSTTMEGEGSAGHCFMSSVLWWWKKNLADGHGASLLPILQPAHSRSAWHQGHSSTERSQCCRQVSCQPRKSFTLQNILWIAWNWHLLIIMELGSCTDSVSHACPVLCEVGCPCYIHTRSNTCLVWRTSVLLSFSWF